MQGSRTASFSRYDCTRCLQMTSRADAIHSTMQYCSTRAPGWMAMAMACHAQVDDVRKNERAATLLLFGKVSFVVLKYG